MSGLRWSEEQLAEFHARRVLEGCEAIFEEGADSEPESVLQRKCEDYLNDRGYPFIRDRSRGINGAGTILDLTVALPLGRTVYIELKSEKGRTSKEQMRTIRALLLLGHEVYIVRSYRRFLKIMAGKLENVG